ncbi:hypothetical protein DXG01_013412 [Tephrocybe rancida]|nr:hypothetical protein DXG01_013412 [Tephrocybe rancida]
MVSTRRRSVVTASEVRAIHENGPGSASSSKLLAVETSDSDAHGPADSGEAVSEWEKRGEKGKAKPKVQLPVKRRKGANSPTTTTIKIIRRKKSISLLFTMPLDVIFARFFFELEPKDLATLTRTSKALRETLMTRNTLTIWKPVREKYEIPEPPQDFSEPRWASLLFGDLDASYVIGSKFETVFPGQDSELINLILYTHDAKQKLEEFHRERKEFVAGALKDLKWLEWYREEDAGYRERKQLRAVTIRQKFLDMGYDADDILDTMREESRIEMERRQRMNSRFATFKKVFDAYTLTLLPELWLRYSYWREVAAFPEFDRILSAP